MTDAEHEQTIKRITRQTRFQLSQLTPNIIVHDTVSGQYLTIRTVADWDRLIEAAPA